ncbi:polymeric immunoglobulin receptor-like isoform X3 [Pseudorasbora parva]|uniref:polymeric immunoglobulin receptor-like isoform X3 n=1 Tax=Pseudorasbora parva TaxID=51549 RepID=UPI00351DBAE8
MAVACLQRTHFRVGRHQGVECSSHWTNPVLTIKPGGSVTIPCHYDERNPPQKKYWFSEINQTKIYTDTTEENLSVIDHPDQSLFTVTMRNLQNEDTGHYYWVVETEGQPAATYRFYLKVQSAPDVSVVSSSVSGHEDGNVSVQCFYSSGYQNKLKQWCRYKDQSCYPVGRTDTSQNPSVQISDDGRSSFTVLMTGLRLSDSGWYFCSAGEALNPVHLTVTEEEVNQTTDNPSDSSETENNSNSKAVNEEQKIYPLSLWLAVSAALLLLLILVAFFTWKWKRRPERNGSRTIDAIYSEPEEPALYLHYYSTIKDTCSNDPIKDIIYSTISDAPGSEAKPPAGGAIYSTVTPH